MWQDRADLRLLEHELGDENGVRVSCPAPGKMAPGTMIPPQQRTAKAAGVLSRYQNKAERRTPNAERPMLNSELDVERSALNVSVS